MNIFKSFWQKLTKDRVTEIFEHGYQLGRQHEQENWEHNIRFYLPETIQLVERKFSINILPYYKLDKKTGIDQKRQLTIKEITLIKKK
jgi:hypothetical protein